MFRHPGALWATAILAVMLFAMLFPEAGALDAAGRFEAIDLRGRPALLVGDSLAHAPWPVDRIVIPAQTAPELAAHLRGFSGKLRYRQIVLWPGTTHFSVGEDATSYAAAVVEMVALARASADSVVVVGPMMYTPEQFDLYLAAARGWGATPELVGAARETMLADTQDQVAAGLRHLRRAVPDLPIYDTVAFQRRALQSGDWGTYYRDGAVHPTTYGYQLIRRDLAEMGHPIRLPGVWRRPYFSLHEQARVFRARWFRFLWLARGRLRSRMAGESGPFWSRVRQDELEAEPTLVPETLDRPPGSEP